MKSDEMRKAAVELAEELRETPSFVSVGIGEEEGRPVLLIYFSSNPRPSVLRSLPTQWRHIPVRERNIGKLRPY